MMRNAWWQNGTRLAWAGTLLLLCNCSLALNWDQGQLTCGASENGDPNYAFACLPGYTCDPPFCVANNSRNLGEACSDVRQCGSGDACPLSSTSYACDPNSDLGCQKCVASCALTDAYDAKACSPGEFCASTCSAPPTYDQNGLYVACNPNNMIATCSKSSTCMVDTTCTVPAATATGGIASGWCTQIRQDATSVACLPSCSVQFSAGVFQGDSCGGTAANPQTCVPVGALYKQQFVCMPQGAATPGTLGQACSTVAQPCASGLACIATPAGNLCMELCLLNQGSATCGTNPSYKTCDNIPGIDTTLDNSSGSGSTVAGNASVGYCYQ